MATRYNRINATIPTHRLRQLQTFRETHRVSRSKAIDTALRMMFEAIDRGEDVTFEDEEATDAVQTN